MKKLLLSFNIIIGVLVIAVTISVFFTKLDARRQVIITDTPADDGWYYEDGSEAELSDLEFEDEKCTLRRTVDAEDINGASLCFMSSCANFRLYISGDSISCTASAEEGDPGILIYDYYPELKKAYGVSYGNDYHMIALPDFSGSATLTLQVERLGGGSMRTGFTEARIMHGSTYTLSIISANFWKFMISILIFFVGAVVLVLGMFYTHEISMKLETISLGAMSMVLAIWTNSGTYMMELFTGNAGYVRLINYGSLIVLTIPGITLLMCIVDSVKKSGILLITCMTTATLIIHVAALMSGRDYHDVLIFTHLNFGISVLYGVYIVIYAIVKHKITERSQWIKLAALLIAMFSGVADLVFYYAGLATDMARFSRFGLILFVAVLLAYEINEFFIISQKSREAEMMHRLAHTDGLTGISNRLAFNEFETELRNRAQGSCMFVQFDINDLKKVNDEFGHDRGDEFIKAAASVINEGFGKCGQIFRTGGDEFIAVIFSDEGSKDLKKIYDSCCAAMDKKIDGLNRAKKLAIPLHIAYGAAEYDISSGAPEEAERLADELMYEQKRRMKQANRA